MSARRTNLVSLGLVFLSFAVVAALYGRMPELVPTHWNLAGEADGFASKPLGPFLLPVTVAGTWLLLQVLPRISPRGFGLERFQRPFEVIQLSVVAFVFLVTMLATLAGAGVPISMSRAVPAAVGLLFVVLGNFMGKFTRNFFVGIRTPWTLASDEVWLRTHRLGGKVFVLAGLVLLVSGLLGLGELVLVAAIGVAAVVPVVYSYLLYRRLEGFKRDPPADDG